MSALRVATLRPGFCYDYFRSDPLLENLRGEPDFNSLLEIARTRHENFQRAFF
jgi:hypothetical protein